MQVLKQFSLPIKGMKIGHHDIAYHIDNEFFTSFEQKDFSDCSIDAKVALEKLTDHLVAQITFGGYLKIDCDRCTDPINFPVEGEYEMTIKYDIDEREEEEVVYINPDSPVFNCAKLIFDGIMLSLPLYKTCDEVADKECNPDVLDKFHSEPEVKEEGNALSEALKNLKLK